MQNKNQLISAVIVVGIIIAGTILLKGSRPPLEEPPKKVAEAVAFNECLDSGKYAKMVQDSTQLGSSAGVNGTPKGFILRDGKVTATIDGAEPAAMVVPKIEQALSGTGKIIENPNLPPISPADFMLGDPEAKVAIIEYADFQCPFCGRFFKDAGPAIMNYVKQGRVKFVYRDFAFLGNESVKASEAARCAGEQGKFWEYHDYLYTHQMGENQGAFSNANLKAFAKELGLE